MRGEKVAKLKREVDKMRKGEVDEVEKVREGREILYRKIMGNKRDGRGEVRKIRKKQ